MCSPLVSSLDDTAFMFLDPMSSSKHPTSSFFSKIENYHILHKSIKIKTETQDKALLIPNVYSFLQVCCYNMPN